MFIIKKNLFFFDYKLFKQAFNIVKNKEHLTPGVYSEKKLALQRLKREPPLMSLFQRHEGTGSPLFV